MNKIIKKILSTFIFTFIFSFLVGYLSSCINNYINSTYTCEFTSSININENIDYQELTNIKNNNDKYKNINIDLIKSEKGFYINKNNNTYTLTTFCRYYDNFFLKDKQIVSTRAKTFVKDYLLSKDSNINFINEGIIKENNSSNNYLIGLIVGISISFIILIYYLIIIFIKKKNIKDNQEIILPSIFSKEYWIKATSFISNPKKLCSLAMILALLLISKMIKIPSGFASLGLGLGFIFYSIIGIIYGPLSGLLIGFIADIVGYFLFDTSGTAFFIGYVFQAMISGLIHGLMLYNKKLSFCRCLMLRLTIALICNVIIGSFCWGFVANYTLTQTFSYMILFVIPKNLIYLIPQSIILYIIIKALNPIFIKFNLIDKNISQNITIF